MSSGPASVPAGMPDRIAEALREIGPRVAPAETLALYAPLHPGEPYPNVSVIRDVAYGSHERHVLDVFTPAGARERPVVVFVHGGGFIRGAKRITDTPFYDNVMRAVVEHGAVGVNVSYRLAPEHQWPSGIEDMAAVVAWVRSNVAGHGGDPRRVFLWGHSAGAAHIGDYLADAARGGASAGVAGAILTSGFYDLGDDVSEWHAYYGDDVSRYPERSSLSALGTSGVPLLVTDAELDPQSFRIEAEKLLRARRRAGRPARYVHLPKHSHISEIFAVGTDDRSLSAPVLEFIRELS